MKIGPGVSELCRVENRPVPLTWPMAYTIACTTVQAVIENEQPCTTFKLEVDLGVTSMTESAGPVEVDDEGPGTGAVGSQVTFYIRLLNIMPIKYEFTKDKELSPE